MQSLGASNEYDGLLLSHYQTPLQREANRRDGAETTRIRAISLTLLAGVILSMVAMVWCFGDSGSGGKIAGDPIVLKSVCVHTAHLGKEGKAAEEGPLSAADTSQRRGEAMVCVAKEVSLPSQPLEARGGSVRRAVSATKARQSVLIPVKDKHKDKRRCFTCL